MRLPYRPGPGYFDERYYDKVGEDPSILRARAERLKGMNPTRALEVGCGRGALLRVLQSLGVDVIGVDISSWAARSSSKQVVADDASLPFRDSAFDLVYGFDILEHNMEEYVDQLIAECARVCSRDAYFSVALEGMTDDIVDQTHFVLKPRIWWRKRLERGFEYMGGDEYGSGQFVLRVGRKKAVER